MTRARCALRGPRPHRRRLQQLPQSALPQVPGGRGAHVDGGTPGRALARALLPHRLHNAIETNRACVNIDVLAEMVRERYNVPNEENAFGLNQLEIFG